MGALSDLVVLELSSGVAGGYCGRLLRDLGAQVVKVEPPGGDPLRQESPLVDGASVFYAWLNAGKLNVEDPEGSHLDDLAAHADLVLHSERGESADRLDERLVAANPRAVVVSLTPYGRSGPRAGWETTEFTEYATGGYHYFAGDPAREPLAMHGHQAGFHAGVHAAFGALAAAWHARKTGEGQRIEISHQECLLNGHGWLTTMWTHTGQVQSRQGNAFVKCADGYVFPFGLAPNANLLILMERFDLLEDESLLVPLNWQARFPEVRAALAEWALDKTKQEIYHTAQELRIAITPINTMADLVEDPQLKAREFFASIRVGGRTLMAPGAPYRLSRTPCQPSATAREAGADSDAVLSPEFAWANRGVSYPAEAGGARPAAGPLEGIRVLEVTANWAGPQAGRLMADLGADVIKVELATKPATRALMPVGNDIWPNFYHRVGYFNKQNRNKRAFCLDLSKPAGRETFLDLVERSDVVLENNAARVMGQLGLDYAALQEVNPRLVMCSMSGFGGTGPERNYSAYGSNIETSCGLASVLGYGPGEYFGTGTFYADPVTGNHGAVAIMAALHEAKRSGQGQWIDMALLECAIPLFAQPFLQYQVTGEVPQPRANRSLTMSPQDVYRTAGTDCWLALSVRDEADWTALCEVIGRPELAEDPALQTVEGRRAKGEEIDAAITAWAGARDHITAADELQAAGVPAAPVMPNWEIACDNHLHDRGFFVDVRHPVAGTHRFPGFPWRLEKTPGTIRRHAPMFAEHNREVFEGMLGMGEAEVAALHEAGVTADAPIYQAGPSL